MAVVEFIFDIKAPSFIVGNTNVLKLGEPIVLTDGRIGFGDGVTQLKDLVFNGGSGSGSVWRNGAGAPSNSLGSNGDYYIDTASPNWNVYFKTSGTYSIIGTLKGTNGTPGIDATSNPRITTIASSATIQADFNTTDSHKTTALNTNATLLPPTGTGTPVDDQSMRYRITDNNIMRTLTVSPLFKLMTTPPQYTVPGKTLFIDTSYHADFTAWVITGWGQITN